MQSPNTAQSPYYIHSTYMYNVEGSEWSILYDSVTSSTAVCAGAVCRMLYPDKHVLVLVSMQLAAAGVTSNNVGVLCLAEFIYCACFRLAIQSMRMSVMMK